MAMWLCGYVAMWLCGYQNFKSSNLQISKFQKLKIVGTQDFQKKRKNESRISIDNIFPGCSLIFLDLFEVIWYNEMKKYGAPGPKTSRNY